MIVLINFIFDLKIEKNKNMLNNVTLREIDFYRLQASTSHNATIKKLKDLNVTIRFRNSYLY